MNSNWKERTMTNFMVCALAAAIIGAWTFAVAWVVGLMPHHAVVLDVFGGML